MKCPPMVVTMKFGSEEDEGFFLWIPLFIIAPIALIILLALFLIALPFLLIAMLITWQARWWKWIVFGIQAFFSTLHELPGLKVDIEENKQRIYIAVH